MPPSVGWKVVWAVAAETMHVKKRRTSQRADRFGFNMLPIRFFLGYFTLGCSFSRLSLRRMLAYWERLDRPVPTEQSIALYADWNRIKETEVLPLAASNKYYVVHVSQVESYK